MKRMLLVLAAVFLGSAVCFAQEEAESSGSSVVVSQMFVGSVQFIGKSDPMESSKIEIAVANEQGQIMSFVVTRGIGVRNKTGDPVPFNEVKEGDEVEVEYAVTRGGVVRALTIKVKS